MIKHHNIRQHYTEIKSWAKYFFSIAWKFPHLYRSRLYTNSKNTFYCFMVNSNNDFFFPNNEHFSDRVNELLCNWGWKVAGFPVVTGRKELPTGWYLLAGSPCVFSPVDFPLQQSNMAEKVIREVKGYVWALVSTGQKGRRASSISSGSGEAEAPAVLIGPDVTV